MSKFKNTTGIRSVRSSGDLKRFIRHPFEKYRSDPHWVPPLLIDERQEFNPKKNPFFEHARMELFLAERNGEVLGRVAAIDDSLHNRAHDDNIAFFGFFEASDQATAEALLYHVEGWARLLGRDSVRGPMNPSLNDGAGFQIDAFGSDPYVMMPYNPPEYPRYAEAAGYRKVKDLYAWMFDTSWGAPERISRLAQRVRQRHDDLVVRPANMKRFRAELETLKRIYSEEAWGETWGFVGYTDAEFDRLASELRLIADPDIVLFAELRGQTAGVIVGLPDANQLFKRMRGKLFPFGVFHFLNRKSIIDQMRVPILGLMPEYRNRGLDLVLMHEIYERGMAKGYKRAELSWVLEDNQAINHAFEVGGAKLYKTYRIYQKEIGYPQKS
jgi:GNAT superfamily N-acetyltransferase